MQVSLWNFVRYNVVGGGDSALYGTESATYYLRNGLLNLNVALPLALVAPLLPALWAFSGSGKSLPLYSQGALCHPSHEGVKPCSLKPSRSRLDVFIACMTQLKK